MISILTILILGQDDVNLIDGLPLRGFYWLHYQNKIVIITKNVKIFLMECRSNVLFLLQSKCLYPFLCLIIIVKNIILFWFFWFSTQQKVNSIITMLKLKSIVALNQNQLSKVFWIKYVTRLEGNSIQFNCKQYRCDNEETKVTPDFNDNCLCSHPLQ